MLVIGGIASERDGANDNVPRSSLITASRKLGINASRVAAAFQNLQSLTHRPAPRWQFPTDPVPPNRLRSPLSPTSPYLLS